MTVGAGALVGVCAGDLVAGVADLDTSCAAGDPIMICNLMASLEVGGIIAVATATVSCGTDDMSCGIAVRSAPQGAIRVRGVTLQAVGSCAVAVGILQDISTVAGLTAAGPSEESV